MLRNRTSTQGAVAAAYPAGTSASRWSGLSGRDGLVLATFTATIFLSAFLLFSVQPMYARIVLPKLGGSPSVWAVSMCVFQALLLVGYAYAHLLVRFLGALRANVVHVIVLAGVTLALPIGLPEGASDPTTGDAYLWLIGVLLAGVGLPFFAISANAPLIQAWFAATRHRHAKDPYFLYAASNFGSLLALLSYPVLVEPMLGISRQALLWSGGFLVLAWLILVIGITLRRSSLAPEAALATESGQAAAGDIESRSEAAGAPTLKDRLVWIVLSFLPSAMVVAVTTFVTTDIASAPFLWVIPLALFLLTFILVFRDRMVIDYRLVCMLAPLAAPAAMISQLTSLHGPVAVLLPILAFFVASLVCHRELYVRRPQPRHLTEFYMFMSVGGVLGGIFSALIAPHVFQTAFEFPLLMFLSLLCLPGMVFGRSLSMRRVGVIIGGGVALLALHQGLTWAGVLPAGQASLFVRTALLACGLVLVMKWPEFRVAVILALVAAISQNSNDLNTIHSVRGFFGTHRVLVGDNGNIHRLAHGTTVHGLQRLKGADGRPIETPVPATYYYKDGPLARGVGVARAATLAAGRPFDVGIVGLGAGSIGCYGRPGETWRFFEIDPLVVGIATDPRYFTFMSRCQPSAAIVVGDARLTLAREAKGRYGYLMIDAFSSDSIPVHLLTAEALQLYASRIHDDGIIAIHISNRHLDLAPILASTIAAVPGLVGAVVRDLKPTGLDAAGSIVVFVAKSGERLAPILASKDAQPLVPGSVAAWTDDYSNMLAALIRKMAR